MVRHLVTIDDLSEVEIESIFSLTDEFLARMGTPGKPYRIQGRLNLADDFILATLFYEASTRTRFSFESAMMRLGGHVLSSADPQQAATMRSKSTKIGNTRLERCMDGHSSMLITDDLPNSRFKKDSNGSGTSASVMSSMASCPAR